MGERRRVIGSIARGEREMSVKLMFNEEKNRKKPDFLINGKFRFLKIRIQKFVKNPHSGSQKILKSL